MSIAERLAVLRRSQERFVKQADERALREKEIKAALEKANKDKFFEAAKYILDTSTGANLEDLLSEFQKNIKGFTYQVYLIGERQIGKKQQVEWESDVLDSKKQLAAFLNNRDYGSDLKDPKLVYRARWSKDGYGYQFHATFLCKESFLQRCSQLVVDGCQNRNTERFTQTIDQNRWTRDYLEEVLFQAYLQPDIYSYPPSSSSDDDWSKCWK